MIDDVIATGGTLGASEFLIKQFEGVELLGNVLIFEIGFFKGREKLTVPTHCLITI